MAGWRAEDAEVFLVTASPGPIGSAPGSESGSAPPDVLTAASGLPGFGWWETLFERAITSSRRLGRMLRALRRSLRRRLVRWSAVGIGAAAVLLLESHATRSAAPITAPAPPADVALISVPAVIRSCPVRQNCLSTMTVPSIFTRSVLISFPTLVLTGRASRYDAAIPEVDVEQAVGTLPDGTVLVLTEDRFVRASIADVGVTETHIPAGVLVARQRDHWRLTAQLSAVGGAQPDRVWLDAARRWADTASLPR